MHGSALPEPDSPFVMVAASSICCWQINVRDVDTLRGAALAFTRCSWSFGGRSAPPPGVSPHAFAKSASRDRAGAFAFVDGMACASPHISPRAAMIAQDFFRVRVLGAFSRGARGETPRKKGDGSIATAYVGASMCPHAEKRPARARSAQSAPARNSEKRK